MSRTYRRIHCHWCMDDKELIPRLKKRKYSRRDKKPWHKPPKWFKAMRRRQFRAKCKNAMRNGCLIPIEKNADIWNWT